MVMVFIDHEFIVTENSLRTDLLSRIKLLNGCNVAYEVCLI